MHYPLKSPFGQYYHLHSNRDGAVPRSLKPLRFMSTSSARTFLRQLRTTEGYWQLMARALGEMAPQRGHQRDTLQVICNSLISGRLRIYETQAPDNHSFASNNTTLQHRHGDEYHFAPAAYSLARPQKPQRFHSLMEVPQHLHDLAPNIEQLQSLIANLQLTTAPQSLSYTQLMDMLAEAIADEIVVLYIGSGS